MPWQPTTWVRSTLSGALAAVQAHCTAPTHPQQYRKPGVWVQRWLTIVRDSVPQVCNKEAEMYVVPRISACEVYAVDGQGIQTACMLCTDRKQEDISIQ
jgi:hypothetical protein